MGRSIMRDGIAAAAMAAGIAMGAHLVSTKGPIAERPLIRTAITANDRPVIAVEVDVGKPLVPMSDRTRKLIGWIVILSCGLYTTHLVADRANEWASKRRFERWKRDIGLGKQISDVLSADELIEIAKRPREAKTQTLSRFRTWYSEMITDRIVHRTGLSVMEVDEKVKAAVTLDVAALVLERSLDHDPRGDLVLMYPFGPITDKITQSLLSQILEGKSVLTLPVNSLK